MSAKLPTAVQNQIKRVQEIQDKKAEEMKAAVQEKFDTKTNTGSHADVKSEPKVTPQEVKTEVVKVESQVAPVAVNEQKDAKYWEHRFKTAQGIYEADKQKYKTQISSLEGRLKELENKLTHQAPSTPAKNYDLKKYLSQEEIDTYGEDALATVVKTASAVAKESAERKYQEEHDRLIKPIETKIEQTESALRNQLEDAFWENLTKQVPDWLDTNENSKFREWLGQKDPLTGVVRQNLLDVAQGALDSERVIAIFRAFKAELPAPTPQVEPRVVPDPVAQPANLTSPESTFITRAEIKRFSTEKALGKWNSRPQAREEMEKRIRAAILAGTVR